MYLEKAGSFVLFVMTLLEGNADNSYMNYREDVSKRGISMKQHLKLLKDYVKIRRMDSGAYTFGGDQNFFRAAQRKEASGSEDEKKQKMGCGIIALSDIFLYFSGKYNQSLDWNGKSYVNQKMEQPEYCSYYDEIYTFADGVSLKGGVSGIKLWRKFNRMAKLQGWKERARWGFSQKKRLQRMEEMLGNDIPVLLCIPMAFLKKEKDRKLNLYQKNEAGEYDVKTKTNGHYVVVTELFYEKDELYLVISSWGKQYFIKWKEYEELLKNLLFGVVLGNLLYIR